MQYTPHYNLNLPEGSDIVNPLIQDNPNYTAIDTALYNNKLRAVGTAKHVKTGRNHAITLDDSDINQFKFVATGDYASDDTFTVNGVTVTARIADGSSIPSGAFKINSTVVAVLDGTILNLINVYGSVSAGDVSYDNTGSGLAATDVNAAIDEVNAKIMKIVSAQDYQIDYSYNVWTTHSVTIPTLTTIENAFISMIGGWTAATPHEVTIVGISGNTVTYAGKGMWSGGASGINVKITAIGS